MKIANCTTSRFLLLITLLPLFTLKVNAQYGSDSLIFGKLNVNNSFKFGTNIKDKSFIDFIRINNNVEIIKKNKSVKSLRYIINDNDATLNAINIHFKDNTKSFNIDSLKTFIELTSFKISDNSYIYNNCYQVNFIPSYNEVVVISLNDSPLVYTYDEFDQKGSSESDFAGYHPLINGGECMINFGYFFENKNKTKEVFARIKYNSREWLFITKIEFMLSNGEVLKYEYESDRKVNQFGSCTENINVIFPIEDVNKLLLHDMIKYKISGENGVRYGYINKLHLYELSVVKKEYELNKYLIL